MACTANLACTAIEDYPSTDYFTLNCMLRSGMAREEAQHPIAPERQPAGELGAASRQ